MIKNTLNKIFTLSFDWTTALTIIVISSLLIYLGYRVLQ